MSTIKRVQLHGGLKFGDLVLSIVERDLIQCPLFGVSVKRESTVFIIIIIIIHFFRRVFSECTEAVATSLIPYSYQFSWDLCFYYWL